jgi:hypothetical protein
VRESEADLRELQQRLDESYDSAGEHLRSIFDGEHRLTAREVVDELDGIFEFHLATVAGGGAPLVAPLDGIFFKGKIWFGLPKRSVRAPLVRREPRVSASYTKGSSFALIVHGTARELDEGSALGAEYSACVSELYVALYGPGWPAWRERQRQSPGIGFDGWIEPRKMFVKR